MAEFELTMFRDSHESEGRELLVNKGECFGIKELCFRTGFYSPKIKKIVCESFANLVQKSSLCNFNLSGSGFRAELLIIATMRKTEHGEPSQSSY